MREIKFRAIYKTDQRQDTGKPGYIVSDPIRLQDFDPVNGDSQFDFSDGGYLGFDDIAWSEMIWCEYTGLKDKNGKEICEGDILNINERYTHPDGREFKSGYYEVREMLGTYGIFRKEGWWTISDFPIEIVPNHNQIDKCEVIGNIWENPDLMKEAA